MEATATLEDRVRAWEAEFLSDAATPSYPAERRVEEADSPLRTPFQRDRDRIVHSKAFRRLKHKTQVFIAPEGDHYRTRLTHTLEACGIARTVARALGLNEDLTEAIGLGHDLGHPPFGHSGEEALDAALRERGAGGFRHNEHSLRVVDVLERDGSGLNLTEPVRDGILNHTGSNRPATLEGRIVKLVDRVAYINHDIDDALRAGVLQPDDLPAEEIELLGPTGSQRIDTLVRDIVANSADAGDIAQSEEVGGAMLRLRKFMFDRVYLGPAARHEQERVQRTLRGLFDHYMEHPEETPESEPGASDSQRVTDYLAGMTDRYCIAMFTALTIPEAARFYGAEHRGEAAGMALISAESLERVKQAADIVEVVSAHTDLRRQGSRWVGLCPFHEERTPSFSVDAQEKLYHCFGCGVGGDTIKFVEEKEGLGFAEAVELLADRYGVELEREKEDPRAEARRQQRRRLEELLDRTASFYAAYLWDSEEARKARGYLAERGLGEEVLRAFGVGYAPSAWDQVLLRGQRAGFNVDELRGVGLAQRGRGGGEYDRFRSRIMFPIRDRRGRTLGFGGRAMRSDQGAKYVNTAETDFFHKSTMLYGIDRAKSAIAKVGRAVVVEGYTDVLALHHAGVEEAIGVMGTAITEEQVAALSGMVEEVVLALDADSAGQEAMLRAQRVAAGRRMRIRVAAMPAGEDPAEMVAADGGAERFRALVEGAVELPVFQVGLVLDRTDSSSPSERDRAMGEIAPIMAAMGETASRDDLLRRVAQELDMDPAMLMGRITAARPLSGGRAEESPGGGGAPAPVRRSAAELTSRERRERALLAMCIAMPEEGGEFLEKLTEAHLSPLGARAHAWLREHPEEPASNLPHDDSELAGLIAELVILANEEPASAEAMRLNFLLLEQRRLEAEISAAGAADDYERRAALSRERAALVERIARTERVG